jgi:hypothetical protein
MKKIATVAISLCGAIALAAMVSCISLLFARDEPHTHSAACSNASMDMGVHVGWKRGILYAQIHSLDWLPVEGKNRVIERLGGSLSVGVSPGALVHSLPSRIPEPYRVIVDKEVHRIVNDESKRKSVQRVLAAVGYPFPFLILARDIDPLEIQIEPRPFDRSTSLWFMDRYFFYRAIEDAGSLDRVNHTGLALNVAISWLTIWIFRGTLNALRRFRSYVRRRKRLCERCAYPFEGLSSAQCPECGRRAEGSVN